MRRRDFLGIIGGAAVCPMVARAQEPSRRRIGMLLPFAADAQTLARNEAFLQALRQSGWSEGHNIQIEYRWSDGDHDRMRKHAAELAALAPDVIFASGSASLAPLQQATRTVPIVFAAVPDPVGSGFVDSLARLGGNTTGFTTFESGFAAKWLELLKEVAPNVQRAAVIRDPAIPAGLGQWGAIQSVAPSMRIDLTPVNIRDAGEMERAIAAFGRTPGGGLILTGSGLAIVRRDLIIKLAAEHKLPAVYYEHHFVVTGGLISYGPDFIDQFRSAASYVDRILKGEKPADLPVQTPSKFELSINLKTAKALGLTVPSSVLSRADKMIE